LAGLGGSVVFTLVMLPTAAAALQTLGLEIIANPVIRLLDQVLDLVPRFIAGGVIVFIAIVLGRLLSSLVTAALTSAGLNRLPERLGMGSNTLLGGRDLAEWAGTLTMTAALLMAAVQAFEVIGFPALTRAAETLGSTLANLVVALVLLGVGAWLGALAFKAVSAMAGARNPWLARVAQVAVLVFAAALALRQAGLPADIVALAFGGRDVARRLLNAAAGRAGERPEATASEEVSR
jgi:hypothetical protein